MTEHFMEVPGIGGHDLIAITASVGIFIQSDGNGFILKCGNAFNIFLILFVESYLKS